MNEEDEKPTDGEAPVVLTDPGQAQEYIAEILTELLPLSRLTANRRLQFFLVEALTAAQVAPAARDTSMTTS